MMESKDTDLPHLGRKTTLSLESGNRIEVVIHTNGMRDISVSEPGDEDPRHILRLDPTSACALGALLCAALQDPRGE